MKIMFDGLDVALEKGDLCSLYHKKEEPSLFLVGIVTHLEETGNILVTLIDKGGAQDGLLLISALCIYRVEVGSTYLKSIKWIEDTRLQVPLKNKAWTSLLQYAKSQKIAVQAQSYNGRKLAIGFVAHYTDLSLDIQVIHCSGRVGKICHLQRRMIGLLFCGTESEISLMNRYAEVKNHRKLSCR